MAVKEICSKEARPIEAVIDTGITVIAHFENPAQDCALDLFTKILRDKLRCLIPTSTIIGAYHIMTEYLCVEKESACLVLANTLRTRSPALYPDLPINFAVDALTYASEYSIESWDGYLYTIAKAHNVPKIFSIDEQLAKKLKDIEVVNPIPEREYNQYKDWIKENISRAH